MTTLPDGFQHLSSYFAQPCQAALLDDVRKVIVAAPLYTPAMPRTGKLLSVAMTNCGDLGWVTDQQHGYRYEAAHPLTGEPWPPIPKRLIDLWFDVSRQSAPPQACLVNYYHGRAKMGSHRDQDEADFSAPVVSVSLGDTAIFHIGGLRRCEPKVRVPLISGDVVILGDRSRLAYHGVDRVLAGSSNLLAEGGRINLTLRRVTPPST